MTLSRDNAATDENYGNACIKFSLLHNFLIETEFQPRNFMGYDLVMFACAVE